MGNFCFRCIFCRLASWLLTSRVFTKRKHLAASGMLFVTVTATCFCLICFFRVPPSYGMIRHIVCHLFALLLRGDQINESLCPRSRLVLPGVVLHAVRDYQSRTYIFEQMRPGLVVHLSPGVYFRCLCLSCRLVCYYSPHLGTSQKNRGSFCSIIRSENNFFFFSVFTEKHRDGSGVLGWKSGSFVMQECVQGGRSERWGLY